MSLTKVFFMFLRQEVVKRKSSSGTKQKSSKILVRNVPFEATQKELRELFATFGELKTVRLPKKLSGTGPHRGFAFIDFLTKQDAKVSEDKSNTSETIALWFCGCNWDYHTLLESIQIIVYKHSFIRTTFGFGMG